MKRLLACVLLFSLIMMIASSFVSAEVEYEDLRTPEERGEDDFSDFWESPDYCKYFDTYRKCWKTTKNNAIETVKERGRRFCKKLEAVGVEFSDIDVKETDNPRGYSFSAKVHAKCVFK